MEIKETNKPVTLYIASDGKEFVSELSCQHYELELQLRKDIDQKEKITVESNNGTFDFYFIDNLDELKTFVKYIEIVKDGCFDVLDYKRYFGDNTINNYIGHWVTYNVDHFNSRLISIYTVEEMKELAIETRDIATKEIALYDVLLEKMKEN